MWNDTETTNDLLNFQIVADTAAQLIKEAEDQPISIGISGSWGVGKSSLSKMITKSLKEYPGKNKYVFVDFDAWLYQGYDDARLALLQIVSDRLTLESEEYATIKDKAKDFAKRINWLRVGKMVAPVIGNAVMGGTVGGPIGAVIGAVSGIVKTGMMPTEEQLCTLKDAYSNMSPELTALLKNQETKSIPKEISELRKLFTEILDGLGIKLIVTIDDLDRCLPNTAISTLEAIRLLLFLPNTAFIIAADEQMIREAVRGHFNITDMSEDLVTSYFDKLIQIPIRVPRLGTNETKAYVTLLLAQHRMKGGVISTEQYNTAQESLLKAVKKSWSEELTLGRLKDSFGDAAPAIQVDLEIADQLATLLVNSDQIKGNPRLIKRFLNDLMIRRSVAEAQGLSISFDQQVKLQLFERCATPQAFDILVQGISPDDGKVGFLKELELQVKEGKNINPPDNSWTNPFIRGWLELQPQLGDTDIRPLVYLSKDRSISLFSSDDLSPESQQIIARLESVSKMDTDLIGRIVNVGQTEAGRILIRLKKAIRARQWEHKSLVQSLHIVKAFPGLAEDFVSLLREMPSDKRQPPLIPLISGDSWAIPILREWEVDKQTQHRPYPEMSYQKLI
jgi:predicted KAP-like P-loop ATPase